MLEALSVLSLVGLVNGIPSHLLPDCPDTAAMLLPWLYPTSLAEK